MFNSRAISKEIMDGDDYDFTEYETTLDQLALLNRWTGGYPATKRAIAGFAARRSGSRLRVLDIGFGGGDTLRDLHIWAKARGISLDLFGVDLNPRAKAIAQARTPAEFGIQYMTSDIFDLAGFEADVMINSLFMHHLDDTQVLRILRWMSQEARIGWFINDLHRHAIAYHFIRTVTPFLGFNRLICNDAPLSVARAFTRADWQRYAIQAGLQRDNISIRWHWPFRYGITYRTEAL